MKKILSMIFIGLIVFSILTISAGASFSEEENTIMPEYCGPNDIGCNRPQLDIVFVVDSTGSMYDEIRTVKEELINMVDIVKKGYPVPDVKIGVVAYRDYEQEEHEYLTREKQLTYDTRSVVRFIRNIDAYGGGDYEEAVEAGLDKAINQMNWRSNSKKIIILVGDAPARDYPFFDYREEHGNNPEYPYHYNWRDAIKDAENKDIVIYTASGSGMNAKGIEQWKEMARKTGGSYVNLIYHRAPIKKYYAEKGIDFGFVAEARASADYDPNTDSIMTNNLGDFVTKSLKQEATKAGVEYGLKDITGDFVQKPQNNFKVFLEKIFSKLIFWR
jgi:Mg-chelatase subunit ChlD